MNIKLEMVKIFYRISFETEFKKNVVFLVFWMDVVPKLKFVLFDNYSFVI